MPATEFRDFLGARAPDGVPAPDRCAELYLAFACARGHRQALALLEEHYFPALRRKVQRHTRSTALTDEALQMVREWLLGGVAKNYTHAKRRECSFSPRPPGADGTTGIADYAGAGPLAGFLRIVAVRTTLRLVEREQRAVPLDDALAARLVSRDDPELRLVRERFGAALPEALRAAWRGLSAEERNLIRFRYVDGHSIDDLAAVHRVHRATAARRVQRAEDRLVEEALAWLTRRFGVSAEEMRSVLRLVRSQLGLSARGLFGEP